MAMPDNVRDREFQKFIDGTPDIALTAVAATSVDIWTAASANQGRLKHLRVRNKSSTDAVYCLLKKSASDSTATTTSNGVEIDAGDTLVINSAGYDRVTCIRAGGAASADVRVEALSIS